MFSLKKRKRPVIIEKRTLAESDRNAMKRICTGILAHVDAGKTTLSEALLYCSGAVRKLGRVDHQDAFLDTHAHRYPHSFR